MEKVLALEQSMQLLKRYRIPFAPYGIAKSLNQAIKVANDIGYPVAIKAIGKKIIHKTDIGALKLNIESDKQLEKSFAEITKAVRKKLKTKINGILVQSMVDKGQEVIIGGKHDGQFGKVLMFGLGGIFTEVFDDVSFRVVPITKNDAKNMIEEIKGYKILKNYRGSKYDIESLIDILLKTSKLLSENRKIKELDINPLIISSKSTIAVDARMVVE